MWFKNYVCNNSIDLQPSQLIAFAMRWRSQLLSSLFKDNIGTYYSPDIYIIYLPMPHVPTYLYLTLLLIQKDLLLRRVMRSPVFYSSQFHNI